MTTLELIAYTEYLQQRGFISDQITKEDFELWVIRYLKEVNKPEWTDKFFPPSTPENK